MNGSTRFASILMVLMVLGSPLWGQMPKQPGTKVPDGVEYLPSLTYCKVGDEELKLDLARPKDGKGPYPALVFVHGGGWAGGNRSGHVGNALEAASRGYVAVTVSYRLAPKHPFPAAIEDVKCAVRWLRAHAKEYGVDPNRIGAAGDSAGGHLVGLLGTAGASAGLEGKGGYEKESSKVQAVVSLYGPFDLGHMWEKTPTQPEAQGTLVRFLLKGFLGDEPEKAGETYKKASPITYAAKDNPPFLLIHGTADLLVPIEQTERFAARLREVGANVEVLRIDKAGHGFGGKDREQVLAAMAEFFDKHLKKK